MTSSPVGETTTDTLLPSQEAKLGISTATIAPRARTAGNSEIVPPGAFTILVTKGKELFTPWAYNSFEVGPLALQREFTGVSYATAYSELACALEELWEVEYQIKLAAFREHAIEAKNQRPTESRVS